MDIKTRVAVQKYQREWRREVAQALRRRLGEACIRCGRNPGEFLVIPDRRSPELLPYGNNTITIYNKILQGKLPLERVTLLCDECKLIFRLEQNAA